MDQAEDTKNAANDITEKLEIPSIKNPIEPVRSKVIPYTKVIQYLKSDERNSIECKYIYNYNMILLLLYCVILENYEPSQKIVKQTMISHGHKP